MNFSTAVPPWVRFAQPADDDWTGLPAVARHYLQLACVPLALLSAVIVWSTWAAGHAMLTLDVVAAVLATAAVPLLATRRQLLGVVALAVLAAISPAATPAATAMAVVIARVRPPRVAILVAGAGLAGHLVQGLWREIPLPFGWWALCVAAVYAALTGWGAWSRTRIELLRSLHERAVRAEQEQAARIQRAKSDERARIAREMHDSLAHHLTLIATTAGAIEYRPDADPATTHAAAGRVRDFAGEALVELRAILRVLRTSEEELRPMPGLDALPTLIDEARADGTDVRWERTGQENPPAAVGLAAYRVLQEALTNARRHASGAAIEVTLTTGPGHLELAVVNDAPSRASVITEGSGTGLIGLAERVELLDGTLSARPTDDGGFAVLASIPWQPWTRSGSS